MALLSVRIGLSECYTRDKKLLCYISDCTIDGWDRPAVRSTLEEIADHVRDEVAFQEATRIFAGELIGGTSSPLSKPNYNIILSQGLHSLDKCPGGCDHDRYSGRPDEKTREKLAGLLNNEELFEEAIRKAQEKVRNGVKVIELD